MALDKDILGIDLYTRAKAFNEVFIDEADMEVKRTEFWKSIAEGIITHFKTAGTLNVPGLGLTSSTGPVTGLSTTGTIL